MYPLLPGSDCCCSDGQGKKSWQHVTLSTVSEANGPCDGLFHPCPVKYDRAQSSSQSMLTAPSQSNMAVPSHIRFLSHNKQDYIRTTFLFMPYRLRSINTLFASLHHFRILIFPSSLQTIRQSTTTLLKKSSMIY